MGSQNKYFVKKITYDIDDKKRQFKFIGAITYEMKTIFSNNGIYYNKEKKILDISNSVDNNIESFDMLQKENLVLVDENEYYCGLLPRLKSIELKDFSSNKTMTNFVFYVERCSYAMTDCFDQLSILKHPLLEKFSNEFNNFFLKEDILRNKIFEKFNTQYGDDNEKIDLNNNLKKKIKYLNNKFLKDSTGTNSIAISGNIVTSNDRLIITRRSKDVIDPKKLYCSVNGQSEIIDNNVDFYNNSVSVDFPNIDIDSIYRVDFENELNRETNAELNCSLKYHWNYYGFSI